MRWPEECGEVVGEGEGDGLPRTTGGGEVDGECPARLTEEGEVQGEGEGE